MRLMQIEPQLSPSRRTRYHRDVIDSKAEIITEIDFAADAGHVACSLRMTTRMAQTVFHENSRHAGKASENGRRKL